MAKANVRNSERISLATGEGTIKYSPVNNP
jgi:hypothetical protein